MKKVTKTMMTMFAVLCAACSLVAADQQSATEDIAAFEAGLQTIAAKPKLMSTKLLSATSGTTVYPTSNSDMNKTGNHTTPLDLYFDVTMASVSSATLYLNAYDVDYPSATEDDEVYFNGTPIGRLQGYDGGMNLNTFNLPANIVKIGSNHVHIDVSVNPSGWITQIREGTKLVLNGEEGRVTLTVSKDLLNKIELNWSANYSGAAPYNIYRGKTSDNLTIYREGLTVTSFTDTDIVPGDTYYYQIKTMSGVSSTIEEALFVVDELTIELREVDWENGRVEIDWGRNPSTENGQAITYDVYWSTQTNGTEHLVKKGVSERSCTDENYLGHGEGDDGICPIYYTVVGTDGYTACSRRMRNRHGLFVGIDKYEDPALLELGSCVKDAQKWRDMYTANLGASNPRLMTDSECTKEAVLGKLSDFASAAQIGDVFLYTHSSHGDYDLLRCYDSRKSNASSNISANEFANALKQFRKGVGVVVVLDTCSSGTIPPAMNAPKLMAAKLSPVLSTPTSRSFVESVISSMGAPNKTPRLLMSATPTALQSSSTEERITSGSEIGWLTAVNETEDSVDGVFSEDCLLTAGWKYGGADRRSSGNGDGYVDFGELGRFAKYWCGRMYDQYGMSPQMFSESILNNIRAGRVTDRNYRQFLATPQNVAATTDRNDGIEVTWTPVNGAVAYWVCFSSKNGELHAKLVEGDSWLIQSTDDYSVAFGQPFQIYVKAWNLMDVSERSETVVGVRSAHYTLKFDANGGIGEMADEEFVVGIEKSLPLNAFQRDGYTFGGWGLAPNSVAAAYDDGEAVTDVCMQDGASDTLYAMWIPDVIEITFIYGPFAGKFDSKVVDYTVGTVFHNFPIVTSTKWDVKGWFTSPTGGIRCQAGEVLPFTKDGTLFLQAEYSGTNPHPDDDLDDVWTDQLIIGTTELPNAMELECYETQLWCTGGTGPYWWYMPDAGYLTKNEERSFAKVGEAQGWREDGGSWRYELPFSFLCCGCEYKTVHVYDDATLEFVDDFGRGTSIYAGFGDLYSVDARQDIFVEQDQDHVMFRWNRVKSSDPDNPVNYAVTLYSNGVIRCSFGDCGDATRFVEVCGLYVYGAYVEQEGDADIVFTPNYLPIGLWLDGDGVLCGIPEQSGHYTFEVMVQDDNGEVCSKILSLEVTPNSGYTTVNGCLLKDGTLLVKVPSRTSVVIPDGVTSIREWAFESCGSLTSVVIPSSVTSIDTSAFEGCNSLATVYVDAGDADRIRGLLEDSGFDVSNLTFIGSDVVGVEVVDGIAWFYTINNGEAQVGTGLPNGDGLAIPESTTGAITIPSTLGGCPVTSIGYEAFWGCSELTSVTIPSSVTSIGGCAFWYCGKLDSVIIPPSMANIEGDVFCYTPFYDNLADGMVIFGSVFYKYKGMCPSAVSIPEGVASIGEFAFENCDTLTSVSIPSSVTTIEYCAFNGCSGLTSVTIHSSVTNIGWCAFGVCDSLTTVYVDAGDADRIRGLLEDSDFDVASVAFVEGIKVTSVTAQQRYPWNGLVDITVTIQGTAEDMAEAEWSFAATNSATKAAIPIKHITQNGDDVVSNGVVTRKFIWDVKADAGAVKIDDVALTVNAEIPLGGVQLWENGPYWAERNVGATKPEECGYYFWWGDTIGYKCNSANNGWVSVKDGSSFSFSSGNCPTEDKNDSQLQLAGYIDATGNLAAAHDAATAHLGAPWRMPTDAEFSALINNCTTTWTTRNGVSGRLITGKGAYSSKSIFLPAIGIGYDSALYGLGSDGSDWSSTPNSGDSYGAWGQYFDSNTFGLVSDGRSYGRAVRPVRESVGAAEPLTDVGVTTHLTLDSSANYAFNYEFNGDGITLTGIASGTPSGALTIPSTYDGQTVTSIGEYAFADCNGLTSVVIPSSVTSIGSGAFVDCGGLTSVTIPSSVTSIGEDSFLGSAFSGCGGRIKSFVVDASNPNYCAINGLLCSKNGETLIAGVNGDVTIPSCVTSVGEYAFIGCSGLASVTIPSSVTSVGEYAFCKCRGLTSVTILCNYSAFLSSVGVFDGCDNLRTIYVSPEQGWEEVCQSGTWQGRSIKMKTAVLIAVDGEGTATGAGSYDSGAKVALKAMPAAGYVFAGWYENGMIPEGIDVDYRVASLTYTVPPRNVSLTARFVAKEEDTSISINGYFYEFGYPAGQQFWSSLEIDSASLPTVSVSGLPAGLKFDAKTFVISGTPTMPGEYDIKVTAKNLSKATATETFRIKIQNYYCTLNDHGLLDAYDFTPGVVVDSEAVFGSEVLAELGFGGWTVTGLPAGVKFDAKTGLFSGAATAEKKSYTVYFSKKHSDGTTEKGSATFRTEAFPILSLVPVVSDGMGGVIADEAVLKTFKLTGGKGYAANTKASIGATAAKGYVFAGWYLDETLSIPAILANDYRQAANTFVTEDVDSTLYARFVTADEDAMMLSADVEDFYFVDSDWELPVRIESISLPSATVSGLPAGLKFDAKACTISGRPTKPGEYKVTLNLSNLSVKNKAQTFWISVPNLRSAMIYGLDHDIAYELTAGVSVAEVFGAITADEGCSLSVSGLPAGIKFDVKTGLVTGATTAKPGFYTVTFTAKKGSYSEVATITLHVTEAPAGVVGTYNGFVESGAVRLGTFQLVANAAGKVSAKAVLAQKTYSFSATYWEKVEGTVYYLCMKTTTGDTLNVWIDTAEAFDVDQLTGMLSLVTGEEFSVLAQANAFGGKWYFKAEGDYSAGWTLSFAPSASEADLTLTMKGDGSTTLSGKLGTYSLNLTSFVSASGMKDGRLTADFLTFQTLGGVKKPFSVSINLWFDRSNERHAGEIGEARFEE